MAMSDDAPAGLLSSLRRLLHSSAEMAEVRLDLFATELQQEKLRVLDSLAWLALAWLALGVGLVLLCLFVVLLIAEPYRLAGLGVIAGLCLAGAWAAWLASRRRGHAGGTPFEASLAELRRDRDALIARDSSAPR